MKALDWQNTALGSLASAELSSAQKSTELLIGPYRCGKTLQVVDQILAEHSRNQLSETFVVVPSQRYKALFEQRLFERMKNLPEHSETVGLVGLHIVNFYDLCQQLLRRSGVRFRVVPEQIRTAVIARVIGRMTKNGELKSLDAVSAFAGTHQNIVSLIDEFERAALPPEDVLAKLELSAHSDSRYVELARVYQSYWLELESIGLMDQRQVGFKLRQVLHDKEIRFPQLGSIYVDGFDRFNKLQLKVFSDVAAYSQKLTICFDYQLAETGEAAHEDYTWKEASHRDLVDILGDQCSVVNHGMQPNQADRRSARAEEKFSCTDRFLELEEVTRRVKQKLVRDRVKPEEILVVARSLKNYGSAVRIAFEDAGIPYFMDEAIELKKLPMVQFLLRLLRLSIEEFPRRQLIDCLRSPYLNKEFTQLSRWDVEEIDRESIKKCIVAGQAQWQELFAAKSSILANEENLAIVESGGVAQVVRTPEAQQLGLLSLLEEAVTGVEAPLLDGKESFKRRSGKIASRLLTLIERLQPPKVGYASDFVVWIEDLLEDLLALQFNADHSAPKRKWTEQRALLEVRRSLSGLLLEETFLGQEEQHYASLLRRFELLIDKGNFRALPEVENAITICGADLAPNKLFEHVFVAGLVEGDFPRKTSQAGFVGADEVARWAAFGIDIANPRFHPSFEASLFENLLSRARSGVQLSYPLLEFSGEELLPSYFLTGGEEKNDVVAVPFLARAAVQPVSPRNLVTGILARCETPDASIGKYETFRNLVETHSVIEVRSLCERIHENVALAHGRLGSERRSVFNGYLVDHVLSGALRVPLPELWSATKLSDYGKCSFKYWASHVVRAKPVEEPHVGLDPLLLGQAYHKALELIYKAFKSAGISLASANAEQTAGLVDAAVDAALKWLVEDTKFRPGEFWHFDMQEVKFRIKRFIGKEIGRALKDKNGFEPEFLEAAFGLAGDRESYPALVIEDVHRQIAIRGRIDRIDLLKGYTDSFRPRVRLIDYKSGSAAIAKDDSYSGKNLQLALYALAVERSIIPSSEVVQAMFLSISSGEAIGNLNLGSWENQKADEADRPKLVAITEQYVKDFVERISQGDFTVAPAGKDVCKNCDHKMICRIGEVESGTRAI